MEQSRHENTDQSLRDIRLSGSRSFRYRRLCGNNEDEICGSLLPRFHLILQGKLDFYIPTGNGVITALPGELVLVSDGSAYSVRETKTHTSSSCLNDSSDATQSLIAELKFENSHSLELFRLFPEFLHFRKSDMIAPDWLQIFSKLLQIEIDVNKPSVLFIDRLLEVLTLEVVRAATKLGFLDPELMQGIRDRGIRNVLVKIHANPEFSWTVSSMASVAAMSRSTFASRFALCLNRTPQAYLRNIRIKKACDLLNRSLMPVDQVSRCRWLQI